MTNQTPLRHIMFDLETLGKQAGCSILSIGAVEFFPDTNHFADDDFYYVINRSTCEALGLIEDEETLAWWEDQSPEARLVLAQAESYTESISLPAACSFFSSWLTKDGMVDPKRIRLYGNGADFDNPILQHGFKVANVPWPIKQGGRCYRTWKTLEELLGSSLQIPTINRRGTHHNALSDAYDQATHLMAILDVMKGKLGVPVS